MARRTTTLSRWLSFLILRERRRKNAVDAAASRFVANKNETQVEYIQAAVSVALLLVQSLLVNNVTEKQRITMDNFAVEIDCCDDLNLGQDPENDGNLNRIIESVTGVEFLPSKSDNSLQANDAVQSDDLFRDIGTILHQFFCRGTKPRLPTTLSSSNEMDANDDDEDRQDDVDRPGAEKGRAKHSMRIAKKMFRGANISSLDEHLLSNGVPNNLCRLVIDLVRNEGNEATKFHSVEDVAEELMQMISKPALFLHERDADSEGQLNFGTTLYGRRNEAASFLRAASLVSLDMRETFVKQLVLVEGLPGAGKTHFVESLIRPCWGAEWIYIHAKFDIQSQPLSVVTSAFNRFFLNALAKRNEREYVARVTSYLQRNLSSSAIVTLCDLIPSLRILFPSILRRVVSDDDLPSQSGRNTDDEFASSSQMSRIRLHVLFRKLISAVCSVERPLVLFLDDLQWADDRSMELLSALLERDHLQELDDDHGTHCLFVGSFRSSEVNDNLHVCIDNFEQSTSVDVTRIHLGGLTRVESNIMLSEVLQLPTRLTSSLNDVVQRKTTGNPFHIITFMHSLVKDSILNYSLSDKRWIWDIDSVKTTSIDETVLELLVRKLIELPEKVVDALKVLSCLAPKVDDAIMKHLYTSSDSRRQFIECLDLAVGQNILEKNEDNEYSFVHDMLKQLAYSVMSEEEKGKQHFWIGMQLTANNSGDTDECNALVFSGADQINAAKSYGITEENLHIKFAELNLKAGKMSIDVSDFQSALTYLKEGVSFLHGWQAGHNYDLSLQLYESAALACYTNADIELMQKYLGILFGNAKCFEDKLHGYLVMIQAMLNHDKHVEATEKILFILEELGEVFSIEVTPKDVYMELVSTKKLLDKIPPEDVICGQRLTDKRIRWRLRFFDLLSCTLFISKPLAIYLTACRVVKLSIEYGFCSESAAGLQGYGWGVLSLQKDVEECIKWCRAGKRLVESLKAKQMIPRATLLLNYVSHWTEPVQASIECLKVNHRELVLVGDLSGNLSLNAMHFCRKVLLCGRNLLTAERECAALLQEIRQLRRHAAIPVINLINSHVSILKLIGSESDKKALFHLLDNSGINNQDELFRHAMSTKLPGPAQQVFFDRLLQAFWFKNYQEAAEYADKYGKCHQAMRFSDNFQTFYQGISAFRLARLNDDKAKEWIDIGKNALSSYQTWVKYSEWNWENKMLLLEAELHSCQGEMEMAKSKFQESIDSAQKHRFIHEEGLARELFGMFYNENGKKEEAKLQYAHARACYQKWGAFALADRLYDSEN